MKIKCLSTTGAGLNKLTMINSGENEQVKYPLEKNVIYTVYGQKIFNNVLKYLIIGTYENLPSWYAAELFEVVDNQVYLEWYYNYEENSRLSAIWGYKEMVLTENHYDDLIERTDEAKRIFLKRKSMSLLSICKLI